VSIRDFVARLSVTPVPWYFARALSWILAIHGLVTGWDYVHTPDTAVGARSLKVVVLIANLHDWGVAFLIVSGVLAAGLATRRHAAVWLGHLLSAGMYGMFTIATAQAVWEYSRTAVEDQQGSIWRAVSQSLVITVLHVILCIIRGPVPRKGDER
jgi:hypothetical protein